MIPGSRFTLGVVAACAIVLALLGAVGFATRSRPAPVQTRIDVTGPAATYRALAATGARERVVVLVDRSARVSDMLFLQSYLDEARGDGEAVVGHRNLTSALIASGIAREVIVVLSPAEWEKFVAFAEKRPGMIRTGQGFRIRQYGSAVVYTNPELLDFPKERPMTVLRSDLASEYPAEFLDRLLAPDHSDVVVSDAGW